MPFGQAAPTTGSGRAIFSTFGLSLSFRKRHKTRSGSRRKQAHYWRDLSRLKLIPQSSPIPSTPPGPSMPWRPRKWKSSFCTRH